MKVNEKQEICVGQGRVGLRKVLVHTPGPAEKAGKSSKSMVNSAGTPLQEELVAVAAALEAADVNEIKGEETVAVAETTAGDVSEVDRGEPS